MTDEKDKLEEAAQMTRDVLRKPTKYYVTERVGDYHVTDEDPERSARLLARCKRKVEVSVARDVLPQNAQLCPECKALDDDENGAETRAESRTT